jgi:hypothetical protein
MENTFYQKEAQIVFLTQLEVEGVTNFNVQLAKTLKRNKELNRNAFGDEGNTYRRNFKCFRRY